MAAGFRMRVETIHSYVMEAVKGLWGLLWDYELMAYGVGFISCSLQRDHLST